MLLSYAPPGLKLMLQFASDLLCCTDVSHNLPLEQHIKAENEYISGFESSLTNKNSSINMSLHQWQLPWLGNVWDHTTELPLDFHAVPWFAEVLHLMLLFSAVIKKSALFVKMLRLRWHLWRSGRAKIRQLRRDRHLGGNAWAFLTGMTPRGLSSLNASQLYNEMMLLTTTYCVTVQYMSMVHV